jgi:molecular chaperone DnaK (HSP70)
MIAGGIALLALGTAAKYIVRAVDSMKSRREAAKNSEDSANDGAAAAEAKQQKAESRSRSHEASPDSSAASPPPQQQQQQTKRAASAVQNSVGFDIGSSFSRVVVRSGSDVKVLINHEGKRQTPVTIRMEPDGSALVGQIARQQRWSKPSSVGASVHLSAGLTVAEFDRMRSLLLGGGSGGADASDVPAVAPGRPEELVVFELGGSPLLASDALFHIIKNMCNQCSPNAHKLGYPATVAVPTFFGSAQRLAAVQAVKRAGIKAVEAVADAQCAVAGARQQGLVPAGADAFVTVVDVGGLYTQLSLVRQHKDNRMDVVKFAHEERLGGDEFDRLYATEIASSFMKEHGVDLLRDPMAKQRVFDAVESSKFELSNKLQSRVNVPFVSASAKGPLHIDVTFSRSKYEAVIAPSLQRLGPSVRAFLMDSAALVAAEPGVQHLLLLVGGGARTPAVRDEVNAAVKKLEGQLKVVIPAEPEEVVAVGAGAISRF